MPAAAEEVDAGVDDVGVTRSSATVGVAVLETVVLVLVLADDDDDDGAGGGAGVGLAPVSDVEEVDVGAAAAEEEDVAGDETVLVGGVDVLVLVGLEEPPPTDPGPPATVP